jgi:hypothetical protein
MLNMQGSSHENPGAGRGHHEDTHLGKKPKEEFLKDFFLRRAPPEEDPNSSI